MKSIKTVTVLGANGTMGSYVGAILAAFLGTKVFMVSRSIEKSIIGIDRAVKSVRADSIRNLLVPKTYDDIKECIDQSDWVFESVAEDESVKESIYKKIGEFIHKDLIVTTGTSGLSLEKLKEQFEPKMQTRFFGTHFFNPPYVMPLCEIVSTSKSDMDLVNSMDQLLREKVYRKTVILRDAPAFVGNRIGFQLMNEALILAEKYADEGGIDYIDAVFGAYTGRAMPLIRTADFVGLDIHKAIVDNIRVNTADDLNNSFILPEYVQNLINNNRLGMKTREGLYKTEVNNSVKRRMVYDIKTDEYRDIKKYEYQYIQDMKSFNSSAQYEKSINLLVGNNSKEVKITKYLIVCYIVYSYLVAKELDLELNDIDTVMSYGFNWIPVKSLYKMIGGKKAVLKMIAEDDNLSDKLKNVNIDKLLDENAEESHIDYRRYMRAK